MNTRSATLTVINKKQQTRICQTTIKRQLLFRDTLASERKCEISGKLFAIAFTLSVRCFSRFLQLVFQLWKVQTIDVSANELSNLAKEHSNIHILELDLRNFDEYDKLINQISEVTKDSGLNVLFNNAGIAPKSVRLGATRQQDLIDTLQTNTVVPVMLTKACLPLLKKASDANANECMGVKRAAIINMSSLLGSIKSNTDGGLLPYRASKAALNAVTKSISIDLAPQKILCVSMHPGWVRTDMGGSNAPLDVATSTTMIVDTICQFNESHNGGFYEYSGAELPW